MKGAREYAKLFQTGQYGRLYIVSGSHARGRTFRIYVLPEGIAAKSSGAGNPPLNCDAVEVYGIISGQAGRDEIYGWLHEGKWQEDFYKLVEEAKEQERKAEEAFMKDQEEEERKKQEKIQQLLSTY